MVADDAPLTDAQFEVLCASCELRAASCCIGVMSAPARGVTRIGQPSKLVV